MNISIILSGGAGRRFGNDLPKQYNKLLGREVIEYSINALQKSSQTDDIIILCDSNYIDCLKEKYNIVCITGGISRNESLKKGLDYIKYKYSDCKKVFITEAARPFLTSNAVITTKKITDSLGKRNEAITCRDDYYLIQAPEAFRFDLLYRYFKAESDITATVQQLPSERKVMEYYDFKFNLKITYPEDMIIAEQIMKLKSEV